MELVRAAREKLESAIELAENLRGGTFPYPHSEEVLRGISALFRSALERLDPEADEKTLRNQCNLTTLLLDDFLPLLGFIHRSKSSANAFELYGPLLRLVRNLVDERSRLVLASEWRFSPFTYVGIPSLNDVVWVGLPASESSNALLTPLAGHEVGHHLWAVRLLSPKYRVETWKALLAKIEADWAEYRRRFADAPADMESFRSDVFAIARWSVHHEWALRQCEEIFCDLVGLRLFGDAYIHAFAYLLAPGSATRGARFYPHLSGRVAYLSKACQHWGFTVPPGYETAWAPAEDGDPTSEEAYLTKITDDSVGTLLPRLLGDVETVIPTDSVPLVDEKEVASAVRSLGILTPTQNPVSLAAVVNAGWRVYHDADVWSGYPHLSHRRASVLNELLLKSIQVGEVAALLKEGQ